MNNSVLELNRHVQILLKFLKLKRPNIGLFNTETYIQNIVLPEANFVELTTPKCVLCKHVYNCTGRLRFYKKSELYIYLEIEEKQFNDGNQPSTAILWPVMCTWKVEMIDENNPDSSEKTVKLGEDSDIFNKPRQGKTENSKDWIRFDLGSISNPMSMTLRWTVTVQPLLSGVCVDEFEAKLEDLGKMCDLYSEPEQFLIDLKQTLDKKKIEENELQKRISQLNSDLNQIVTRQESIQTEQQRHAEQFKELLQKFREEACSN